MTVRPRFALALACVFVSACGTTGGVNTPLPPSSQGSGGGGGSFEADAPSSAPSPAATPADTASPPARESVTPEVTETPDGGADTDEDEETATPAPTPTPSSAAATPTPTPAATATPTPTPSATAAPTASRRLAVQSPQHSVTATSASVGGPLEVVSLDKTAYDTEDQKPFLALAGVDRGRYGWQLKRIDSASQADDWYSDPGNPGAVFFLDSRGGEEDNSGAWTFEQRMGEETYVTRVSPTEHVGLFEPSRVAYTDLGAGGTFNVRLEHGEGFDPFSGYPGVFLVYTGTDGRRDFMIVDETPRPLRARGWVYAFYVTNGPTLPSQSDTLIFEAD